MKNTTTVIISGGNARLISVPSAPNCTQAKRNARNAIEPNPRYVNQMASSATIANSNASAAAKPENLHPPWLRAAFAQVSGGQRRARRSSPRRHPGARFAARAKADHVCSVKAAILSAPGIWEAC